MDRAKAELVVNEKWDAPDGSRDEAFDALWDANWTAAYEAELSYELDAAKDRVDCEGITIDDAWAGAPARAEKAAFQAALNLAVFAEQRRAKKAI